MSYSETKIIFKKIQLVLDVKSVVFFSLFKDSYGLTYVTSQMTNNSFESVCFFGQKSN